MAAIHPAYWVLYQIAQRFPNRTVLVRAEARNEKAEGGKLTTWTSFKHRMPGAELDAACRWLLPALAQQADRWIVYGPNPQREGDRWSRWSDEFSFIPVQLSVDRFYDRDKRMRQVGFLRAVNQLPSWLVDDGKSFYGVYALDTIVTRDRFNFLTARINDCMANRRYRSLLGINALLPLPGFPWGRTGRMASLVHPVIVDTMFGARLYSECELESFLDVSPQELERFAKASGDDAVNIAKELLAESREQAAQTVRTNIATLVAQSEQRKFRKLAEKLSPGIALPEVNVVPSVDALKLPPGCQQLLRYVKAGPRMRHDRMARLVAQQFGKVWGTEIKNCRPLDRKLVQTLVREGYSEEAIVKWWFQPEHRHSVEHQDEYVRALVREEKERWAILAKQTEEPRAVLQPLAEYLDHLVRGKHPVTDECRIHGDVLWLCPRTAYRLYARNMVAEGKTPLTEKEITVLFRNLHHMRAPYWLGKASDDSPYSCCLSMTRLKEHGYGPNLSLLRSAPPPSETPSGSEKA